MAFSLYAAVVPSYQRILEAVSGCSSSRELCRRLGRAAGAHQGAPAPDMPLRLPGEVDRRTLAGDQACARACFLPT
jgi:hypothetical protein